MPGPQGRFGLPHAGLGVALALVAVALVPAGLAHNPAHALFHPVEVGERWLVTGGEGTYAYLTPEGQALDRGNLSGEGEVLRAPDSTGTTAAAMVRSFPDLVPHVQGFDADGPAWRVQVGQAEGHGFVVARGDTFTAFNRDGLMVEIGEDGQRLDETQLPVRPHAEPVPAAEGDWWIATGNEIVRVSDGEVVDRASFDGWPSDVSTDGERVLVSLGHEGQRRATLMVFDRSLELSWSRSVPGLRLGGQPALLDETIVVATYHPDGARVLALDRAEGSVAWNASLGDATAAAPTGLDGRVVLATTDGLVALGPDGTPLWSHPSSPFLDSPAVVGGMVVPTGSANRLVALHPNGTLAWTWSDGVEMPSWTSHHGGSEERSQASAGGPTAWGVPVWPVLLGAGAAAIAFAVVLRLRQR